MTRQTWGLHIPGYSSPSPAQERLFAKMYPNEVAWHRMEMEQREREERQRADEVRRRYMETVTTPRPPAIEQ